MKSQSQRPFILSEHTFILLAGGTLLLIAIAFLIATKTSIALILFFIVILFVLFRNDLWLLFLIAIPSFAIGEVLTIQINRDLSYSMYIGEALIVLTAFFFLFQAARLRSLRLISFDRIAIALGSYLALSFVAYSYILSTQWYIVNFKVALLMFLSYMLGKHLIIGKKRINAFYYSLIIYVLILSLQTFLLSFSNGLSAEVFVSRHLVSLPIGAIAFVSALLIFMIPLIFSFALKQSDKQKAYVMYGVVILGVIATFLLLSKGAFLALFVGMLFFALQDKKYGKRIVLGSTITIVFVALFLSPFFFGLVDRFSIALNDINNQYRIEEYKIAWSVITQHPLLGIGPGQQIVYFQKLFYPDFMNLLNNFYMQSLIDLGIIGLLLFIWLTWEIIRRARQVLLDHNRLLGIGFVSALIIAFLNGLIEVTFFGLAYAVLFWTSVAVMNNLDTYDDIDHHHQL